VEIRVLGKKCCTGGLSSRGERGGQSLGTKLTVVSEHVGVGGGKGDCINQKRSLGGKGGGGSVHETGSNHLRGVLRKRVPMIKPSAVERDDRVKNAQVTREQKRGGLK